MALPQFPLLLLQLADAANGMVYLHTRNPPVLHCDFKSPNLLVSANWTVKVTGWLCGCELGGVAAAQCLGFSFPSAFPGPPKAHALDSCQGTPLLLSSAEQCSAEEEEVHLALLALYPRAHERKQAQSMQPAVP